MKAEVRFMDGWKSINLVCKVLNVSHEGEDNKYAFINEYLSDYQRMKLERFFGKIGAYYAKVEIVRLIPTSTDILRNIKEDGGFNNWQKWNVNEVAKWIKANYSCSKKVAEEVAMLIK